MLKGFSTLKAVRNCYRSLLYQLLKKRENSMKMVTGLAKMSSKLYEINKLHNETISFLQLNPQFVNLPPFLCEVYDIKKQEENLDQLDGNTDVYNAEPSTSLEQSKEIASNPETQNMEWDSLDLDDIEFDSSEYDLSDENEEIQLDKYLHSDEGDIEFENALCAAEQENKDLDSIS